VGEAGESGSYVGGCRRLASSGLWAATAEATSGLGLRERLGTGGPRTRVERGPLESGKRIVIGKEEPPRLLSTGRPQSI